MLRDIPNPHGQFIRETGENHTTQTPHTGPEAAHLRADDTSARARRYDTQSIFDHIKHKILQVALSTTI
jgi:hypothetical protein